VRVQDCWREFILDRQACAGWEINMATSSATIDGVTLPSGIRLMPTSPMHEIVAAYNRNRRTRQSTEEGYKKGNTTDESETDESGTDESGTDEPETAAPKKAASTTDKAVHERAKPYGSVFRRVPNKILGVIMRIGKCPYKLLLILLLFGMMISTCALVNAVVLGTVVYPCYAVESKRIDAHAYNLISGKAVSVYESTPSNLQVFINYTAQIIGCVVYLLSWVPSYSGVFLYYPTRYIGLPIVTFMGPIADILFMFLWINVASSCISVLIMTKYIPITFHQYPGRKLEEFNNYLYFAGIFVYFFSFWHHPLATYCHTRAVVFWGIIWGCIYGYCFYYIKEHFGVDEDYNKNRILARNLRIEGQKVEKAKNFMQDTQKQNSETPTKYSYTKGNLSDNQSRQPSTEHMSMHAAFWNGLCGIGRLISYTSSGVRIAGVKRKLVYVDKDIPDNKRIVIETLFVAQQVKCDLDKDSKGHDECKAWIGLLNTCESHVEATQNLSSKKLKLNQHAVKVVHSYMGTKAPGKYTHSLMQEMIACLQIRMHLLSLRSTLKESAPINRKDVATHFSLAVLHFTSNESFTSNEPTELRDNKRRKLT